jgi:regulator of cell morphogenesis and NO signaling
MKIDYCCGGDLPLGEACTVAGIDLQTLEQLVESENQVASKNKAVEFQSLKLSELIGYILQKHHVYTKEEMTRLEGLIEKVISAHGEKHPELFEVGERFRRLCADLTPHMFKEEQILFPYLIELEKDVNFGEPAPPSCFGTVNNPIRMMMMEHDTAGEILRELRTLSSDYTVPTDACISYQTLYQAMAAFELDLHQHIHLENNLLFPRSIEMEAGR